MASKLQKPSNKAVKPVEVAPEEVVETPVVDSAVEEEAIVEVPKKASKPLVKGEVSKASGVIGDAEREAMRAELLKEIVQDTGAVEVEFLPTMVEGSDEIAEKLNKQEKQLCVWALEEGVPQGFLEEVKINGAVARIPRGVSIYAPKAVAQLIGQYRDAEKTVGQNIKNRAGKTGILADRDAVTKKYTTR